MRMAAPGWWRGSAGGPGYERKRAVEVLAHELVRYPQHSYTPAGHPGIALGVSHLCFLGLMSSAVDFYRETSRRTEEVADVWAKDMLSAKANPAEALSSKGLP